MYVQQLHKGKDRWTKTLPDVLNFIVNWKGGKRPHTQQYEFREGVTLTTKGNLGGFKGDCYNCGKYGHMAWESPEPRK